LWGSPSSGNGGASNLAVQFGTSIAYYQDTSPAYEGRLMFYLGMGATGFLFVIVVIVLVKQRRG
jgi:hypothetical protein